MITVPYPWQQPQWQKTLQQISYERLPHAILLNGQRGIGKLCYAQALANFLLCTSPASDLACGRCRQCLLNEAETHPDKLLVRPEETGKQIKIDQIRQLSVFIAETAQQGGRKVIIIDPIEQLNGNAANALLKNLEEPSQGTYLILVSHVLSGVLATIRSRCHIVNMKTPAYNVASDWLRSVTQGTLNTKLLLMTGGAPLPAKAMIDNPILLEQLETFFKSLVQREHKTLNVVKNCLEIPLLTLLDWWLQLLHCLISQQKLSNSFFQLQQISPLLVPLTAAIDQLNLHWLFRFTDKLLSLKKQVLSGINLNQQLLLEELLLDWYTLISSPT